MSKILAKLSNVVLDEVMIHGCHHSELSEHVMVVSVVLLILGLIGMVLLSSLSLAMAGSVVLTLLGLVVLAM